MCKKLGAKKTSQFKLYIKMSKIKSFLKKSFATSAFVFVASIGFALSNEAVANSALQQNLKTYGKQQLEAELGQVASNLQEASELNDSSIFLSSTCSEAKNNPEKIEQIAAYSTILEVNLASEISQRVATCGQKAENAEAKSLLSVLSILNSVDDRSAFNAFLVENSSTIAKITQDLESNSLPAAGAEIELDSITQPVEEELPLEY